MHFSPSMARCSASMPQVGDLVHVDVERRLVELDHVDAVGFERARLRVEQIGEGERHLHPVAVVLVGDGVDDRHRAGHGDLELALGVRAREARLGAVHAAPELERAGDGRHHRLVAIVADAHLDLVGEVDAVDEFEKAVHEMLARLLAVGDDVDAGVLLQLQREQRRVELAGREIGAREPPLRPQLVRLGEPGGFRQAAGDGGRKHADRSSGLVYSSPSRAWAARCGRAALPAARSPIIEPIVAAQQHLSAGQPQKQVAQHGFGRAPDDRSGRCCGPRCCTFAVRFRRARS